MRLLDTATIEIHEFYSEIPDYAILSHTWGHDEVSFEDLQSRKKLPYRARILRDGVWEEVTIHELPGQPNDNGFGWQKIRSCCALAAHKGYKYVWIDTCCIDKKNSTELTEAINSMFHWYSSAKVCYAYLSDVPSGGVDHRAADSAFRRSRWFTRGWTLQEMLAPRHLEFLSAGWEIIGTKDTLSDVITERTGIPDSMWRWQDASVAAKMSWASGRDCSRLEDQAYSLLGLFGINMPLIYGEGRSAFYRLQLEILKQSADESIFAWTVDTPNTKSDFVGLLADSPENFGRSGNIRVFEFGHHRPHYSVTNRGLQIETCLLEFRQPIMAKLIPLNCTSFEKGSDPSARAVPIALVVRVMDPKSDVVFRIRPQKYSIPLDEWRNIWSAYESVSGSHNQGKGKHQSIYITL